MTKSEMIALDPGRELDAHIAVMVMGFKEVTIVGKHYFTDPIDTSLKEYSTDISAAWEVVEKMPVDIIHPYAGFRLTKLVNSVIVSFDGTEVTGKTAPEAICKAALLAILPGEE